MATSAQSSPHGSLKTYLSVFIALCVLTGVSFAVANSQALMANPSVGWSLMMAVSAGKALLVVLFFMHLKYEANWKYVLTIPTLGMASVTSMNRSWRLARKAMRRAAGWM